MPCFTPQYIITPGGVRVLPSTERQSNLSAIWRVSFNSTSRLSLCSCHSKLGVHPTSRVRNAQGWRLLPSADMVEMVAQTLEIVEIIEIEQLPPPRTGRGLDGKGQ